jgi:hypothetical protein
MILVEMAAQEVGRLRGLSWWTLPISREDVRGSASSQGHQEEIQR